MKTSHRMDIEQESTKTSIENWQDNLNLKADDTADTELTRKPQDVAGMLTGNSGTKQSGSKRGKNATEDVNDRFMSRARFTTEVESRHIGWVMAACAAMIVKWFHRRPFVDQWNAGIISGGGVPPLSHPSAILSPLLAARIAAHATNKYSNSVPIACQAMVINGRGRVRINICS